MKSSKKPRQIFLDFEFSKILHKNVDLVSCATYDPLTGQKMVWWLRNNKKRQAELVAYLNRFDTIIAYSAIAECRSFLSLGLDPLKFRWVDLFLEYRMMTNNNDELGYGKQLVDGKVKFVKKPRPKWERDEGEKAEGFKPTHSLAEATYKLTGEIRDTEHKTKTRDLIISDPKQFTEAEKKQILAYNLEDVVFMPRIWEALQKEFKRLSKDNVEVFAEYLVEAEVRGRYSALTALMESRGYPIDVEATKNFSRQIPTILYDLQREINGLFPHIKPFRWNKKEGRFSWDQKATKEWITKNHDIKRWMKTDKKQISLALEAWEQFYDFKHDYPTNNFGAQMVRFLKLKQSLYGFSEAKDKKRKTFWDYVGPDGMVRPYMNIFGAQSSRSQPGATGFMFLKPAWMRALVVPPIGYFMAGIDYGSQEFFLSGLESKDRNMISAYLSGDPYMAFAKISGQIPKDATRTPAIEPIRNRCKSTVLGLSYRMTKYGLAIKLTADTGRVWSEDEAQEQIDLFEESFEFLKEYQDKIIEDYEDCGHIRLPDGWYMFKDNDNMRSVGNVPIQGRGAVIMRRAVDLCEARGVKILFTLHDALYMIGKIGEEDKIKIMGDCMREAFQSLYEESDWRHKTAAAIKLDPFAWSKDYKADSFVMAKDWKIDSSNLYIDNRSIVDYQRFSKYFKPKAEDSL